MLKDNVLTLKLINYQIADLLRAKARMEAEICALLEHGEEGSQTYEVGSDKVTVTTGWNYTLNKEEWESIGSRLPEEFNPVRVRMAYDLDKKILRKAEMYASAEDLMILADVIEKKPKKLNVKVSALA